VTMALRTTWAEVRSWRCHVDHQSEAAASALAYGSASLEHLKVMS
jgi:hypothetical protein